MSQRLTPGLVLSIFWLTFAGVAQAHDGVTHETSQKAIQHLANSANTPGFPSIKGGDFNLIDQNGLQRTSVDPDGHYQLVFFGYAKCPGICSAALPLMASTVDLLMDMELTVTPVLITVDPERDTVDAMNISVPQFHPKMIGLTGSKAALEEAYQAFGIEKSLAYVSDDYGPVYAHGSFIYLIDPQGQFKTLLPPVLSPQRMAEVSAGYIRGEK